MRETDLGSLNPLVEFLSNARARSMSQHVMYGLVAWETLAPPRATAPRPTVWASVCLCRPQKPVRTSAL